MFRVNIFVIVWSTEILVCFPPPTKLMYIVYAKQYNNSVCVYVLPSVSAKSLLIEMSMCFFILGCKYIGSLTKAIALDITGTLLHYNNSMYCFVLALYIVTRKKANCGWNASLYCP